MSARPVLLPLRFGRRKLKKVVLFLILCLLVGTYFTVRSAPKDSEQHPFHSDQKNAVSNPFDRRGIRVVIGYYTGDDEIKKGENLSKAELNANSYSPVPGVGENGIPVVIPFHETNKMTRLFSINQFNLMASDRISVDRKLPDVRKKRCREKVYPPFSSLPSTSVVIVFHNEAWSTLLRTVHSVINRSPKELLHEIILVDDASEREFLGESLEAYIAGLSVPTRVLRLPSRQGLVKARLFGAQEASGAVLTFLDAHCETTDGWLEPLLFTVSEDRRNVVSPIIDIIDDKTFAYVKSLELHWGGFNWNMHFRWYSIGQAAMDERKRDPTAAFRSPVMAGGLFSIDRKYFYEMGSYDEDMDIWGGENIEMSLRLWQCGGRVLIQPCSHVGHLFRSASPYTFPREGGVGSVLQQNFARVAEVWMDQWKEFFYKLNPGAAKFRDIVDVSGRKHLRESVLKCRGFEYFLKEAWDEHFMPNASRIVGQIVNAHFPSRCLQRVAPNDEVQVADCVQPGKMWYPPQIFIGTEKGMIRGDEATCLDSPDERRVFAATCIAQNVNQQWKMKNGMFVHSASSLCLDLSSTNKKAVLRSCDVSVQQQYWTFQSLSWEVRVD